VRRVRGSFVSVTTYQIKTITIEALFCV